MAFHVLKFIVSLASHEQKEAISPTHDYFFLREVDKVGLIAMYITRVAEQIWQVWQPSDQCLLNDAEKPASHDRVCPAAW